MLKKSASSVLASFRASTYPRGYASALHSLRPCWTNFLSILRERASVVLQWFFRNLFGSMPGAAAPGLFLITERDRRRTATRAEEVFGKRLDNGRVIALAAENVEVSVVRVVRKMAADQRGRDQLHHGIAGNAA